MDLSKFSHRHLVLLAVVLLIGIIHVSHHFLMPRFINDSRQIYYPLVFNLEFDQTVTYGPRVRAAFLDRILGGDVSLAESAGLLLPLPIVNPLVLSLLAKIAGSMELAFILSDFVFPMSIFLLVYYFLLEIFRKKWVAIIGGIIFIFAPTIGILVPPVSFNGLKLLFFELWPLGSAPGPLYFSRFEYPNVTYIFYLFAILFVYRSLKYEKKLDLVLAGLGVGSLFYTYLYDWVYVLCGLGIMGLLFLCQKNYQKLKLLLYIIIIALICSSYYWLVFFRLTAAPYYADLVSRIGFETGRMFRFFTWKTYLRSIFMIVLLRLAFGKHDKILSVYLSGLLLPIIIVLNLQIITAFNPQPDHWYRELFFPLFLALAALASWFYSRYRNYFPKLLALTVVILLAGSLVIGEAWNQFLYSKNYAPQHTISQSRLDSYRWLKKNTQQGSVVAALSPQTNAELLLHTNNKVLYPNGILAAVSNNELWGRLLITNLLFGVSAENFDQALDANQYLLLHLFHDSYLVNKSFNGSFKAGYEHEVPMAERQSRVQEYLKMKDDFSSLQLPYKIDYLYFDAEINSFEPEKIFLGRLLYDQGEIKIYEFLKR